jgi:hypothetical protein
MAIAHAPSRILCKDVTKQNEVVFFIVGLINRLYGFAAPSVEIQDLIDLHNSFPLFQNHCTGISNRGGKNLFERERHVLDNLNSQYDFQTSSIKQDIANLCEIITRVDKDDLRSVASLYSTLSDLRKTLIDLEERKGALALKPLTEDEISRLIDSKIREKMGTGQE